MIRISAHVHINLLLLLVCYYVNLLKQNQTALSIIAFLILHHSLNDVSTLRPFLPVE